MSDIICFRNLLSVLENFCVNSILSLMKIKLHRLAKLVLTVLPLTIALAAFLFVSGSDRNSPVSASVDASLLLPSSQTVPPLLPAEPESGNHSATLRGDAPGSPLQLIVSRRESNPVPSRCFRDGNVGIVRRKLDFVISYLSAESEEYPLRFIFQTFLQRSLPPRAGPYIV